MTDRTNEEWLAELSSGESGRGAAVADLRAILVRGLHKAVGTADGAGHDQIEDFAQDALIKVLAGLGSFRGDSRFVTWALAVATRVAFSELRKARYKDVSLDGLTADGRHLPEAAALPEGEAGDRTAVLPLLRRLIDSDLTDKQRLVIRAELDGVPQAVLVERLGSNRNAIYKLSHDARMRLEKSLEKAGVTGDGVRAAFAGAS